MKSPWGGDYHLASREETVRYKGEEITYTPNFYICEKTGNEFSDFDLDEKNMEQVYMLYGQLHGRQNSK